MAHHCHALECKRACPPEYLMCGSHWRMVPQALQSDVWKTFRQRKGGPPTLEWCIAADKAVTDVARQEGLSAAIIWRGTVTHGFQGSYFPESLKSEKGPPDGQGADGG